MTDRSVSRDTLPSGHGRDVVPDWVGTRVHDVAVSSEGEAGWLDDGGQ